MEISMAPISATVYRPPYIVWWPIGTMPISIPIPFHIQISSDAFQMLFSISGFLTWKLAARGERVARVSKSGRIPRQARVSILLPFLCAREEMLELYQSCMT